MNCGVCYAHLRAKNLCYGCRIPGGYKAKTCVQCFIRNCEKRKGDFCYTCSEYPCKKLKHMDTRYRAKYSMSELENLEAIKKSGVKAFVEKEKARWKCPNCAATLTVHKDSCLACGYQWRISEGARGA